jgi:hypothetical protein
MPDYRCYLFNSSNWIDRVVDFQARSDADACEQADALYKSRGTDFLELWRGEAKVYCSGPELPRP